MLDTTPSRATWWFPISSIGHYGIAAFCGFFASGLTDMASPRNKPLMWTANVFVSFGAGLLMNRRPVSNARRWSFLIPTTLLVLGLADDARTWSPDWAHAPRATYLFETYFGKDCSSNECLSQFFIAVPCIASIAYCASTLLRRKPR